MWREFVAGTATKDMLNGASNLTKTMISGGQNNSKRTERGRKGEV